MALILGVTPKFRFYLNDTMVEVLASSFTDIDIEIEGKQFHITDQESTEVYPNVFVSVGKPQANRPTEYELLPRLVIDAPRSITILREDLYKRSKHGNEGLPHSADYR